MADDLQAARERWKQWKCDRDAYRLADAYCELYDETPIAEEWAREIAIKHSMNLGTNQFGWYFDTPGIRAGQLKTRGQVRCLLLAMGVMHGS